MNRRVDIHIHRDEPSIGARLIEWLIMAAVYLVAMGVAVAALVYLLRGVL